MNRKLRAILSLILAFSMISVPAVYASDSEGNTYYVSTDGDDAASGSEAEPWRTIQHGLDNLEPGDTLYILGGTYNEKLVMENSGTEDAYITVKAAPAEEGYQRVIVDGTDVNDRLIMFAMCDISYVRVEGIEFCNNFNRAEGWEANVGIQVEASDEGGSVGIQIVNNKIYNMDSETWLEEGDSGNGNGIAVFGYGKSEDAAVRDILVEGNEVFYIRSGWSETVTFNGNVNGFIARGNYIHDNNNIGLDAIGGEDWLGFEKLWMLENLESLTIGGEPAEITAEDIDEWESDWTEEWEDLLEQVDYESDIMQLNRARNGMFVGNVVINSTGHGNSAYNGPGGCDGIYVDGGYNITIADNFVLGAPYGIEIASEIGESFLPTGIVIRNNIVSFNENGSVLLGGTRGARDVLLENNTLYNPNVSPLELRRNGAGPFTVTNNIIISAGDTAWNDGSGTPEVVYDGTNLFFGSTDEIPEGAGELSDVLPVESLEDGAFTPIDGVTQGARLTVETTPFLEEALANYAARLAAAEVSDAVYDAIIANRGSADSPLSVDVFGGNVCDYFANLEGVAGTGTEVFLKSSFNEWGDNADFDEYSLYFGYFTVGHGEDGKVNEIDEARSFVLSSYNWDDEDANDAGRALRIWFRTPYEANGQTSYIVRSANVFVTTGAVEFADIDHWAKEYIEFVVAEGLMSGVTDDTFEPEGNVTLAEFVDALRLVGDIEIDVTDELLTREEMAKVLYLFIGDEAAGGADGFADADEISPDALDAVNAVHAAGLMGGKPGNRFDPLKLTTRAEVATVLFRLAR